MNALAIIALTESRCGLLPGMLRQPTHQHHISRPRQIAILLIRQHTACSTRRIGLMLGMNQSSVVRATAHAREMIATSPEMARLVADLHGRITAAEN